MNLRWIRLLNAIVPGAGLIVLRREWLGLAIALLFCLLSQIAVVGLLLLPAVVPHWLATTAGACAAMCWAWSQLLLLRRARWAAGDSLARELVLLRDRSDDVARTGELDAAIDLIRAALMLDDEDSTLNRTWATLATRAGRPADAVKAWRRVVQLTNDAGVRDEARRALAMLRSRADTRRADP